MNNVDFHYSGQQLCRKMAVKYKIDSIDSTKFCVIVWVSFFSIDHLAPKQLSNFFYFPLLSLAMRFPSLALLRSFISPSVNGAFDMHCIHLCQ